MNLVRKVFSNKYVLWLTIFLGYLLLFVSGANFGKLIGELAVWLILLVLALTVYVIFGRTHRDGIIALLLLGYFYQAADATRLFDVAGGIGYTLGSIVQGMTIVGTVVFFLVMLFVLGWMIVSGQNAMSGPRGPN